MADHDTTAAEPRRGNLGAKILIGLLVLLLLAGVGLFFGDRYARGRAEKQVATSLQQQLGTAQAPSVTMHGWPFLTQLWSNHYDQIDIDATDVKNLAVPVRTLKATLSDVDSTRDMSQSKAKTVKGTALVAWDDVKGMLNDTPIQYVEPDRVKVNYQASVFGLQVEAVVTAKPRIDESSQLVLDDPTIKIAQVGMPQDMAKSLMTTLVKPIPVPLPGGLKATAVASTPDGLSLDIEGTDVDLTQLG